MTNKELLSRKYLIQNGPYCPHHLILNALIPKIPIFSTTFFKMCFEYGECLYSNKHLNCFDTRVFTLCFYILHIEICQIVKKLWLFKVATLKRWCLVGAFALPLSKYHKILKIANNIDLEFFSKMLSSKFI